MSANGLKKLSQELRDILPGPSQTCDELDRFAAEWQDDLARQRDVLERVLNSVEAAQMGVRDLEGFAAIDRAKSTLRRALEGIKLPITSAEQDAAAFAGQNERLLKAVGAETFYQALENIARLQKTYAAMQEQYNKMVVQRINKTTNQCVLCGHDMSLHVARSKGGFLCCAFDCQCDTTGGKK